LGLLISQLRLCIHFDKNGLGYIVGIFSQAHLVILAMAAIPIWEIGRLA
jgi:hypothetical protein